MPKLSKEQAEVRRQQILRAMFNCLAEKGYARVTMRDIAKEAGISVGTLYLYFDDKNEIIAALQQQSDERVDADLGKPADQTPVQELQSNIDYLLMEMEEPDIGPTLRVDLQIWAESVHHDSLGALVRQVLGDKTQMFANLIRAAQAEGDLPVELDPESLARVLIAVISGMELQKALEPDLQIKPIVSLLESLRQVLSYGARE